ncbi:hypothetical protein C4R89_00650 [Clostridioides difficile]|nr:hypothetical protein [Clostridioides difficile]MDB0438045.1 hypothetical protein [Clostridioides difficile]
MNKSKYNILKEYNFSDKEIESVGIDNFHITNCGKLWTPTTDKFGNLIKTGEQAHAEWLKLQTNPPKLQPSIEEINIDRIKILIENQKEQDSLLIDNAYRVAILELNTNNVL